MATKYSKGIYNEELSRREHMVLELVTAGLTNQEIADALCISKRTSRTYVDHILRKLYIDNRTTAATLAILRGWVTLERIVTLWGVYHPELIEKD